MHPVWQNCGKFPVDITTKKPGLPDAGKCVEESIFIALFA